LPRPTPVALVRHRLWPSRPHARVERGVAQGRRCLRLYSYRSGGNSIPLGCHEPEGLHRATTSNRFAALAAALALGSVGSGLSIGRIKPLLAEANAPRSLRTGQSTGRIGSNQCSAYLGSRADEADAIAPRNSSGPAWHGTVPADPDRQRLPVSIACLLLRAYALMATCRRRAERDRALLPFSRTCARIPRSAPAPRC